MQLRLKQKVTWALLVTIVSSMIPVLYTNAQVSIPVTDFSHTAATTAQTTTLGLLLNNPADKGLLQGAEAASTVCDGIDSAEKIASTADTFSNFSIIGGSTAGAVTLSARIKALQTVMACREATLATVNKLPVTSVSGATQQAKKQNELSADIASLDGRIESLKVQQSAEVKDVLKAVMVRIILNLNKTLTTELVNKMVAKYKIDDYLAYADAVGTQIYSMKYINENYQGDDRTQMMIRSLIQSEKFPEKAQVAMSFARDKAQEYVGAYCNNIATGNNTSWANDKSALQCLASYGSEQSSPLFQILNAVDEAGKVKAAGAATAQQEIAESDGFAPPRDCGGSIDMQNKIDADYETATTESLTASTVLERLRSSNAPQAEIDKAFDAVVAAGQKKLQLQNDYDSPIIDICKAIESPAKFVSDSIGGYLKSHLDQAGTLQSTNLPFYASFISDVASNFLTNLITGGKSTSQVFKEAGSAALNNAIPIIGSVAQAGSSNNPAYVEPDKPGSVSIYAYRSGDPSKSQTTVLAAGQVYTLVIDFGNLRDRNPEQVNINGIAGVNNSFQLTANEIQKGVLELELTGDGRNFTVIANFVRQPVGYEPAGQPFTVGTGTRSFTAGSVNGATTTTFSPRGGSTTFSPR